MTMEQLASVVGLAGAAIATAAFVYRQIRRRKASIVIDRKDDVSNIFWSSKPVRCWLILPKMANQLIKSDEAAIQSILQSYMQSEDFPEGDVLQPGGRLEFETQKSGHHLIVVRHEDIKSILLSHVYVQLGMQYIFEFMESRKRVHIKQVASIQINLGKAHRRLPSGPAARLPANFSKVTAKVARRSSIRSGTA